MIQSNSNTDNLQKLYRDSSEKVRKINLNKPEAEKKYKKYVEFIKCFGQEGDSVLDIGCGSGWSSYMLAEEGLKTTGVDLHEDRYEPEQNTNLKYMQADAQDLPFSEGAFKITSTNECLEHVPNPEKMLSEMVRVTEVGGFVVVVGPNLLSLGHSLRAIFKYVWQHNPKRRILFRDKDLPFHPLGNTLPETIYYLIRNVFFILIKSFSQKCSFRMRTPDLRPPFHADSDSCYLLNPIDLKKYFSDKSKYEIKQSGAIGRPQYAEYIAAGTWFCVKILAK